MSTIIKAGDSANDGAGVAFEFDDMRDWAGRYLEQARAQAAAIIETARRDALAISQGAAEQGRQAAQGAAEAHIREQTATLLPALDEAIRSIEHSRQTWLLHWEQSAVHVACAIAGRVLRREQQKCPEIALPLVKEALELASGSPEIEVHLSERDYEALGPQVEQLAREIARLGQTKIVSDAAISPGGCRVHTRFGTIDHQFEAQLARIEQELS